MRRTRRRMAQPVNRGPSVRAQRWKTARRVRDFVPLAFVKYVTARSDACLAEACSVGPPARTGYPVRPGHRLDLLAVEVEDDLLDLLAADLNVEVRGHASSRGDHFAVPPGAVAPAAPQHAGRWWRRRRRRRRGRRRRRPRRRRERHRRIVVVGRLCSFSSPTTVTTSVCEQAGLVRERPVERAGRALAGCQHVPDQVIAGVAGAVWSRCCRRCRRSGS